MMQHPLLDDDDNCNLFGSRRSSEGGDAGEGERGRRWKAKAARNDAGSLERSTAMEECAGSRRKRGVRRASLTSSECAETESEAGTASTASTATSQRRKHTVTNGDTLEGICINYGCSVSISIAPVPCSKQPPIPPQVSDLKRLNNLLWHSDSIHSRKVLVIPDKMKSSRSPLHANPSQLLHLKHDLSAHPSNLKLFVDSAGGKRTTLESDGKLKAGACAH
ncbi:hypothetical protein BC830DRAFT_908706 [Chytriomyces sp. MP71]|nr:hypothetical protein BC830DRAFT_908706 [Chytriomyces sp. MP71]